MKSLLPALVLAALATMLCSCAPAIMTGTIPTPTAPGGEAHGRLIARTLHLANDAVASTWDLSQNRLRWIAFSDRINGEGLPGSWDAFTVVVWKDKAADKSFEYRSTHMTIVGEPKLLDAPLNPKSPKASDRIPGKMGEVTMVSKDGKLQVTWRAILRDGDTYIRQTLSIKALTEDLPIKEIIALRQKLPNAREGGKVKGSPVVTDTLYVGFEHPLSTAEIKTVTPQPKKDKAGKIVKAAAPPYQHATVTLPRVVPLAKGKTYDCSFVIGVSSPDQMRRCFLYYLQRERAHPYRPFLHYNSWYDIGCFTKYNEKDCVDVINTYGRELVQKRGCPIQSFLFDDGWDNTATLWDFHDGFPNGFAPLKAAADKYGTNPGVWLSPWGGYGGPRAQRLAAGAKFGAETSKGGGFALSGPKYYKRFQEICLNFVKQYGVNQFKFDGISPNSGYVEGSEFGSDFEAAIYLIKAIREERAETFINLTTGTWPSPFWTMICDSIWRGGWDHEFKGVGTKRQQWITYRDGDIYNRIVLRGPLFPLNSLMFHGVIYAKHAHGLRYDPANDLRDEIRCAFGSGSQLQELYITPALMSQTNWDDLAQSALWARANADVLVDTHWIGGDPYKLECYGWASWIPSKAAFTLRNPSDKPQIFQLDVAEILELPTMAATKWTCKTPYADQRIKLLQLAAGTKVAVQLQPFEVLAFDCTPTK